ARGVAERARAQRGRPGQLPADERPRPLHVSDGPRQREARPHRGSPDAPREGGRDGPRSRGGGGRQGPPPERDLPEEALIPDPARVRRILVRANNWIGDVVMISPAVKALRERFTGAEIAILARPWVLDALAANPFFDRLIPYESPGRHAGLFGRLRLAAQLRRDRFDMAVLFQKAFEAAFLAKAAGIPVRVGHATDRRSWLLTDRVPVTPESELRHHVDFFLEVAEA